MGNWTEQSPSTQPLASSSRTAGSQEARETIPALGPGPSPPPRRPQAGRTSPAKRFPSAQTAGLPSPFRVHVPLDEEHTGFLLSSSDALDLSGTPRKQSIRNPEEARAVSHLPDLSPLHRLAHGWPGWGWGGQRHGTTPRPSPQGRRLRRCPSCHRHTQCRTRQNQAALGSAPSGNRKTQPRAACRLALDHATVS